MANVSPNKQTIISAPGYCIQFSVRSRGSGKENNRLILRALYRCCTCMHETLPEITDPSVDRKCFCFTSRLRCIITISFSLGDSKFSECSPVAGEVGRRQTVWINRVCLRAPCGPHLPTINQYYSGHWQPDRPFIGLWNDQTSAHKHVYIYRYVWVTQTTSSPNCLYFFNGLRTDLLRSWIIIQGWSYCLFFVWPSSTQITFCFLNI